MRTTGIRIATLAALALGAAACGSGDETWTLAQKPDDLNYGPQSVVPGSFGLEDAAAGGDPSCEVVVSLVLANGFGGALASLRDVLPDECLGFAQSNERVYNLVEKAPSCGSRHYVGRRDASYGGAGRPMEVRVADHRTRVCKDLVPATIVVTEIYEGGRERTLLSTH